MKRIIRSFLISAASLFILTQIITSISLGNTPLVFLLVSLGFYLGTLVVEPFFKILFFLPFNFLILHLATLATNFLVLFVITSFIPQFKIQPYDFPGFLYQGFTIPQISLNFIQTILASAFLVSICMVVLHWLVE